LNVSRRPAVIEASGGITAGIRPMEPKLVDASSYHSVGYLKHQLMPPACPRGSRFAGATGRSTLFAPIRLRGALVNIAVWITSGLLAAAYLFIGGTKLLTSKERLAEYKQWPVNAVFLALAVFIGVVRTAEVVR
jgi:hypothetical protein